MTYPLGRGADGGFLLAFGPFLDVYLFKFKCLDSNENGVRKKKMMREGGRDRGRKKGREGGIEGGRKGGREG